MAVTHRVQSSGFKNNHMSCFLNLPSVPSPKSVLARGMQFSTGHAVWHELEQFSSKLNNISLVCAGAIYRTEVYTEVYVDRRLSISEEALGAFGKSQTFSADDRYIGAEGTTEGRKQNRSKSKSCKIGEIKYRQNITCWNCNQKGHFQNQCLKVVASRDKVVNMAPGDSDDVLVSCIENTVEDRIMDSGASFHATYCKEELERFKLRFGKVRLADDKTLDIAGVRDLKVTKGSLVVAHRNKRGSLYMVGVHPERIVAIINGSGSVAVWFGEAEESFLYNVSKDKETIETVAGVAIQLVQPTKFNRIPYVLIGLRIPEEEWRGKDTSLTHLKVFGCDSFVKVKDVCEEAMKCTFIGSGSDEMRYSFWDTKSHQFIQSRDITFVDSIYGARSATYSSSLMKTIQKSQVVLVDIPENLVENDSIVAEHGLMEASRIVENQMKNTLKTEHPPRRKALRFHMYEGPPESPRLQ
ncbi:retrovirus-related pol polyprotein from transposon TNT 1-94 [Tanacetum coccineum]